MRRNPLAQCYGKKPAIMSNAFLTPTESERRQVAEMLAAERLAAVNAGLLPVRMRHTFYTRYGKRALDIVFALIAIVLTLPVNLLIGVVTFFDVGRPILFRQQRAGLNGRLFAIVKFRNMRETRSAQGRLLPPNERVTSWGKFVRKTSLDELLNFISVLKGDMSFIGPRPLLPEYLPRYHLRHRMRHCVRPGLECPPREHSNRAWTWQEQLDNDIWYVENISFGVDCKMMWNLLRFAFNHQTTAARAEAARGYFMGYSEQGVAVEWGEIPQEYIERALRQPPV